MDSLPKFTKTSIKVIDEDRNELDEVTKMITETYNERMARNISRTPKTEDSKNEISFTEKEVTYLRVYFKYASEKLMVSHEVDEYHNLDILYKSINLTEWMLLCKGLGVFEFLAGARDVVRTLSSLFKKNADENRKVYFDCFCLSFGMLVQTMCRFEKSTDEQNSIKIVKQFLGIYSEWNNFQKLEKMGLKFPTRKLKTMNRAHKSLDSSLLMNTKSSRSDYKTLKQEMGETKEKSSHNSFFEKINESTSVAVKKYIKQENEIRSKLLKSLQESCVSRLLPKEEIEKDLKDYVNEDARFLKDYQKHKKEIKDGILKKLEKVQTKYTSSNKPIIKKKSKLYRDKSEIF